MDYQVLMGVGDCIANLPKEFQPVSDRQLARIAVLRERITLNVLHHEICEAVRCGPAVEQASDVGVSQPRLNLPFRTKTPQDEARTHSVPNNFDRNGCIELSIDTK